MATTCRTPLVCKENLKLGHKLPLVARICGRCMRCPGERCEHGCQRGRTGQSVIKATGRQSEPTGALKSFHGDMEWYVGRQVSPNKQNNNMETLAECDHRKSVSLTLLVMSEQGKCERSGQRAPGTLRLHVLTPNKATCRADADYYWGTAR